VVVLVRLAVQTMVLLVLLTQAVVEAVEVLVEA
jgi:hypothetical protein